MGQWKVPAQKKGTRLVQFLKEVCSEELSVKAIKKAIDHKCCLVNGIIETFSSYVLQEGDQITFKPFEEVELTVSVLYEDEHLLVVNKPSGLVSNAKELGFPDYFLVHRLDKETSGALILAKTAASKKALEKMFKEHQIDKLYIAFVDGAFKKAEGIIDNQLGQVGSYSGQTLYGKVPKGQRAITHFKQLGAGKKATLVALEPKTGRTHQLRVHMSGMGHPILGDRQYAKRFICPFVPRRNLLHAYQIQFEHPMTRKQLKVTAPIPADFKEVMKRETIDR